MRENRLLHVLGELREREELGQGSESLSTSLSGLELARLAAHIASPHATVADSSVSSGSIHRNAASALAAATGLALTGQRTTAIVQVPITSAGVATAVRRHVPWVAYVACPESSGAGLLGLAHTGAVQLYATTAQDVLSLGLLAHHIAERALVPVLVGMDGARTGSSPASVDLPGLSAVGDFLKSAADPMAPSTPAQQILFGRSRLRVPRWHDLDRAVLLDPLHERASGGLAAAGHDAYFSKHVPELLAESFRAVARAFDMSLGALKHHRVRGAKLVLVVVGSQYSTACAVADYLHREGRARVGVVGLRSIRPFPSSELVQLLDAAERVVVLERADVPLADAAPLTGDVRLALESAPPVSRWSLGAKAKKPHLVTALFGAYGYPLRGADLVELCRRPLSELPARVHVGVPFRAGASSYPKRQVAIDALQHAYPELEAQNVVASSRHDVRAPGSLSVAVAHAGESDVARRLGELLHALLGGQVVCAVGEAYPDRIDVVEHSPNGELAHEDHPKVDLVALFAKEAPPTLAKVDSSEATVLVEGQRSGVPAAGSRFILPDAEQPDAARAEARRLGAIVGILVSARKLSSTPARIHSAFQKLLEPAQRDALGAAFNAGLDEVRTAEPPRSSVPEQPVAGPLPSLLRRSAQNTLAPVFSLPEFYNEVQVLYREGQQDELAVEPRVASSVVPALSSWLREGAGTARQLPVLDADACTGCGRCWESCPDAAILPAALTAKELLAGLVAATRERGENADALKPWLGKLASKLESQVRGADRAGYQLTERLFEETLSKLAETRAKAAREAAEALLETARELQLIRTDAFFTGASALLQLTIHPDACKSCGVCIAECEPKALSAMTAEASRIELGRKRYQLWEALPDTSGATIDAMRKRGELSDLATALLSRHVALALAPGDDAEPGSGERAALRTTLALAELHGQKRLQAALLDLKGAREAVAARIKDTITGAFPVEDVEALARGLDDVAGERAELSELLGRVERAVHTERVEVAALGRLVEHGRKLADVFWRMEAGPLGFGRARAGAVLCPSDELGIGRFPYNPFGVPVVLERSAPAAVGLGIAEGMLRQSADAVDALRLARLELENPRSVKLLTEGRRLHEYADLAAEEQRFIAPLVLAAPAAALTAGALALVVQSGLPIKVLLFAQADLADRSVVELLALGHQGAFVAQASPGEPGHFAETLESAFAFKGPAIMQVHAPSPRRHGFSLDGYRAQAELALRSRAYPLFTYDPGAEGIFGERLSLAANPEPHQLWVSGPDGRALTPLDFALSEKRYAAQWLPSGDEAGVSAERFFAGSVQERHGKVPVCATERGQLKPDTELMRTVDRQVSAWRTLQELSGVLTPFTERVQERAQQAVLAEHAQELAALKAEHEAELNELRARYQQELTGRLRDRLLGMAGYAADDAPRRPS